MLNGRYCCLGLLGLLLASLLLAVSIGSVAIPLTTVLDALWRPLLGQSSTEMTARIVLELRLPRVLMAMLCGAGLALCGWVLQSITRNPLADPYLFGIASGASLGAVLAMAFGVSAWGLSGSAFVGALTAALLVLSLARHGRIETLILAGVAISFLLSSLASLVLYFADPQAIQAVLFWSLGSFARVQWSDLPTPALLLSVTVLIVMQQYRPLLALLSGDESAQTQGIAVLPLRLGMLLLCALLTASLVSLCGGIGFVGLMVPHLSRLLLAHSGVLIVPLTALMGALLMVWVDLLARTMLPNQELPVGVLTAILGSLFFLGLLIRQQRRSI
ncbi:MAG: iron ABC transporter permease [Ferrimonas sp.]